MRTAVLEFIDAVRAAEQAIGASGPISAEQWRLHLA
jgi:hypothetical protein